jgi:hypothetical protein
MHDDCTPTPRACAFCNTPINPRPDRVRKGLGRFCSTACASYWQAERLNSQPPETGFWGKVDRSGGPDSCWNWTAALNQNGYGVWGGNRKIGLKSGIAHRAAWVLTYGPIPDGMFICHHCDNPPCCNPAHLFLGTPQDNMDDMDRKGRRVSVSRPADLNPNAKLTWDDVREIRRLYRRGVRGCGSKVLAERFGTTHQSVLAIVNNRQWIEVGE